MVESKNWAAADRLIKEVAGRDALQNFFKDRVPPGWLLVMAAALTKYAASGKVPPEQTKDLNDLIEVLREARRKVAQDPASKKWSVQEPSED